MTLKKNLKDDWLRVLRSDIYLRCTGYLHLYHLTPKAEKEYFDPFGVLLNEFFDVEWIKTDLPFYVMQANSHNYLQSTKNPDYYIYGISAQPDKERMQRAKNLLGSIEAYEELRYKPLSDSLGTGYGLMSNAVKTQILSKPQDPALENIRNLSPQTYIECFSLPADIAKEAGLTNKEILKIVTLSDMHHWGFHRIADWIERNL